MTNLFSCMVLVLCLALQTYSTSIDYEFEKFVSDYNKQYSDQSEYELRKKIFAGNVEKIENHNKSGKSYQMAINQYADLSSHEFYVLKKLDKTPYMMPKKSQIQTQFKSFFEGDLPSEVDLRKEGAVNPIKDQGQCGSCWAFSAISSIESAFAMKTNELVQLSEQQLVSCSTENSGCFGGFMDEAFEYLMEKHGEVCLEQDYPYEAQDSPCNEYNCQSPVNVTSYYWLQATNYAMKSAVVNHNVAVGITANMGFQFYSSGIFDDATCALEEPNHAVNVVGYGSEGGVPYYIVRNSWGEFWGENGYMKIKIVDEPHVGVCRILGYALIVEVE